VQVEVVGVEITECVGLLAPDADILQLNKNADVVLEGGVGSHRGELLPAWCGRIA